MTSITNAFENPVPSRAARRHRWQLVRDLLGGALVLAVWLTLWTVTWAAVAGPLAPDVSTRAVAASERSS
jgi:hypothetical protein